MIDSYLDLTARFAALPLDHPTRAEIEAVGRRNAGAACRPRTRAARRATISARSPRRSAPGCGSSTSGASRPRRRTSSEARRARGTPMRTGSPGSQRSRPSGHRLRDGASTRLCALGPRARRPPTCRHPRSRAAAPGARGADSGRSSGVPRGSYCVWHPRVEARALAKPDEAAGRRVVGRPDPGEVAAGNETVRPRARGARRRSSRRVRPCRSRRAGRRSPGRSSAREEHLRQARLRRAPAHRRSRGRCCRRRRRWLAKTRP